MDIESIRLLFGYNRWVNHLLLDTAEQVPTERLSESFGMSFDTILGTLAHILSAQIHWLQRWRGATMPERPAIDTSGGLPAIRAQWRSHEEDLEAFLAELTTERLAAPLRYADGRGGSAVLPLWQAMMHIVNHGTHHRSELADMLTRTGHAPEPTGFRGYCLELTGQQP